MKVPGVREKSRAKTKPAQVGRRILYLQIAMDFYRCLKWVKSRKAHTEQMLSALPSIATNARTFRIGSFVPERGGNVPKRPHPSPTGTFCRRYYAARSALCLIA